MKKILGILTVFLTTSTIAAASFSDLADTHKYYQAVTWAEELKIINGHPDGTFRPDNAVNKAESLRIILRGANITLNEEAPIEFPDIKTSDWFYKYVQTAYALKIIEGEGDGTFGGNADVTLAAFLRMLLTANAIDTSLYKNQSHANDVQATDWFSEYLGYAKQYNLITPNLRNNLMPNRKVSRGEAMEMIYKLYQLKSGGSLQSDLSAVEASFAAMLIHLNNNDLSAAILEADKAFAFATAALAAEPDSTLLQGVLKISESFQKLTLAYKAAVESNPTEATALAEVSVTLATEAATLEASLQPLSDFIKTNVEDLLAQINE